MRNLPLLLALLLLSALLGATSAQASLLPVPVPALPFAAAEEEDETAEAETEEAEDEEEFCAFEEEEEELCEEEEFAPKGKGKDKGEECLLKSATAAITTNPGKRRLRLSVRYKTLKPATVNVEASLQGPKGAVRLGTEHTRFRRSGVYRDTFSLPEKQMKKVLAAREFSVELRVVDAPASCDVELTKASPRARR
ncbi:MAG TPA: hypothetical protein VF255_05885 [Solirubrobacterales bacterium]